MDFASMIEKIMPYVQVGDSAELFIISRQNGEWVLTHAHSAEIADDILESVKEKDPIAIKLLGRDFSRGSFPFVSGKVLIYRLYEEEKALLEQHKENNFATLDNNKLDVFVNFLEDCMPEFSQNIVDLMASVDKPLELLYNKVFKDREISYTNDLDSDGILNENIGNEIADEIENYADTAINLMNEKAKNAKPKMDGYEELNSTEINNRVMFLGENVNAEHRYMVGEYRWDNAFGVMENEFKGITSNYLEAIGEYTKRVQYNINCVETQRDSREWEGIEPVTLTAADCITGGMNENLEGKLIIIKPDSISPEYRSSDYQFKIAKGGSGTQPDSRGSAVFCKDLYSGRESRYERNDVLGVADLEILPKWAKIKLTILQDKEVFEYGRHHFKPYRQFVKGEIGRPDPNDIYYAMRNMVEDADCGYKHEGLHEQFYAASGDSKADIFKCIENDKLYVPFGNILFQYNEPPIYSQLVEKSAAQLHKECAAMIDKVVKEARTPGEMAGTAYYDFTTVLDKLNDNFGSERISEVLAAIIIRSDDGRYSRENKAWAKSFDSAVIEETIHNIRYATIDTHPCVLNGFADDVRKQKPSLLDKLDNSKKKALAQQPEPKDNPIKKRNGPEVT